jgi:hypothetical protein
MRQAVPVRELGDRIFEGANARLRKSRYDFGMLLEVSPVGNRQSRGLAAVSYHSFYRGLPGLWACLDLDCTGLERCERGGPTGKLYSQPRESCDHCGARVLELYTCRNCGTAMHELTRTCSRARFSLG